MNRYWTLILPFLLLASTVYAQEVVLIRETPLYERPSLEATTRATLPVGIKLTLNTRQSEWLAVTTSEGLIGWIPRSAAHVEDETPPAGVAPTPTPTPQQPTQNERPVAQAEPSQSDPVILGFFNRRKRSAISFSMGSLNSQDQFSDAGTAWQIDLSWATRRGKRFEGGAKVSGSRFDLGISEFWYDLQVGGKIKVFILQPRGVTPIGVYGGGLLAWTQYFLGSNVSSNVNTLHYGGEGGAYLHLGGKYLIVPRAALRVEKVSYLGSDRPPGYVVSEGVSKDGTFTSFVLGLDVSFGGFVPGLWLTFRDSTQMFTGRVTFAY